MSDVAAAKVRSCRHLVRSLSNHTRQHATNVVNQSANASAQRQANHARAVSCLELASVPLPFTTLRLTPTSVHISRPISQTRASKRIHRRYRSPPTPDRSFTRHTHRFKRYSRPIPTLRHRQGTLLRPSPTATPKRGPNYRHPILHTSCFSLEPRPFSAFSPCLTPTPFPPTILR
jgi:hypothetical protein